MAITPEQTIDFLEARLEVIRGKQNELREVEHFIEGKLAKYRGRPSRQPAK